MHVRETTELQVDPQIIVSPYILLLQISLEVSFVFKSKIISTCS
ncbi:unnamed protein product [Musa acuminata subsp. malaccensis]|uniref:(wild Malaysian banana) hypothetical protein n=1 Tax=Musa acuminata subsp. malaccensis TaxID=214687 RepID=A0A804JW85_MUSAM|nr:unnamed protein product [Musa acuminata subsp. malaccensis]